MSGFRLYAWSLAVTRTYLLESRAIDSLRGGPPVILAPNHPCLIDALADFDAPSEHCVRDEVGS